MDELRHQLVDDTGLVGDLRDLDPDRGSATIALIRTLGENLKSAMRAITFELPVGIEVTQIADQPHIVDDSVSEFLRSFAEALAIVLVVSFLSLGWRTGIVVALSVPLVLAIVFAGDVRAGHGTWTASRSAR